MSPQTYLINLKESSDRMMAMQDSLSQFSVDFERVEAIDAQALTDDIYATVTAPNIEYPHQLRPGEIACFLSHRKCWQELIDSNSEWALVLEDHCDFSPKAEKYLKSSDWIPKGCDLVQLIFTETPSYTNQQIDLPDGNALIKLLCSSSRRASAYFISRKAAELALRESLQIPSPVDNFLFGPWSDYSKKVPCWRLLGAVVRRNAQAETTILGRGSKNKTRNKERFYPKRIWLKLGMKFKRLFLKKHYQSWVTE